jgi:hypothetical protein
MEKIRAGARSGARSEERERENHGMKRELRGNGKEADPL